MSEGQPFTSDCSRAVGPDSPNAMEPVFKAPADDAACLLPAQDHALRICGVGEQDCSHPPALLPCVCCRCVQACSGPAETYLSRRAPGARCCGPARGGGREQVCRQAQAHVRNRCAGRHMCMTRPRQGGQALDQYAHTQRGLPATASRPHTKSVPARIHRPTRFRACALPQLPPPLPHCI